MLLGLIVGLTAAELESEDARRFGGKHAPAIGEKVASWPNGAAGSATDLPRGKRP